MSSTSKVSKKITIIIHLFTPTARFLTARTSEVFRVAQNKATCSHFQICGTSGLSAKNVILPKQQAVFMGLVPVKSAIG
jgi:hypothetical protein